MKKLDVETLLATARERTGLSDFGPTDFMDGLSVLVEGVNAEADIAADRWDDMVEQRFLRLLIDRLRFATDLAEHPEILDEEIGSPVIIASLPRTGSTKLHRLLGATQDFQTIHLWNAHMFSRIPDMPDGGKSERIKETRAYETWLYKTSSAILTGHPLFTDEPEEDQWMMECTFRHPLIFGLFHSIKYAHWIAQTDLKPTFDYFLKQLKYQQWQWNAERAKPWLLKTPNHLGNEQFLTAIFNKPRFIVTHRDPAKCVSSITSTGMAMRRLYSDQDSSATLSAGIVEMFSGVANRHMRWRDENPDIEILDLSFREVTEDGVGTARKVYEFLGMPFTAETKRRVEEWEHQNPKDKHGKAIYSAAAIGSTDELIRASFAAYIDRFSEYLG